MALLQYTGKNVFGVGIGNDLHCLLPGINEIEDKILVSMKEHPLFKRRIEKGLVQIMLENTGKDGKRSIDDMLGYIPKIYDTKLLKKIIDSDGRDRVIKCAQDQLEKIKNPEKAKRDESDGHFK